MTGLRKLWSIVLLAGLGTAVIHPIILDIQAQYVPTQQLALQRYIDMQRFQMQTPPDRVQISRFQETEHGDVYDVWLSVNQHEQEAPIQVQLQESVFGYRPVLERVDVKWQLIYKKKTPWT